MTLVGKSPIRSLSPLQMGVLYPWLLTTYDPWDDPPSIVVSCHSIVVYGTIHKNSNMSTFIMWDPNAINLRTISGDGLSHKYTHFFWYSLYL